MREGVARWERGWKRKDKELRCSGEWQPASHEMTRAAQKGCVYCLQKLEGAEGIEVGNRFIKKGTGTEAVWV